MSNVADGERDVGSATASQHDKHRVSLPRPLVGAGRVAADFVRGGRLGQLNLWTFALSVVYGARSLVERWLVPAAAASVEAGADRPLPAGPLLCVTRVEPLLLQPPGSPRLVCSSAVLCRQHVVAAACVCSAVVSISMHRLLVSPLKKNFPCVSRIYVNFLSIFLYRCDFNNLGCESNQHFEGMCSTSPINLVNNIQMSFFLNLFLSRFLASEVPV